MKTLITSILLIFLSNYTILNAKEKNCQSVLQKLKPSCNVLGKGAKKLKMISENNKTVSQTLKNQGVKINEKSLSLKELNKKYKPIKLGKPKK